MFLVSTSVISATNFEQGEDYSFSEEPIGEIKVVASLSVVADWAAEIGKGLFVPAAVVTGGEDPHTFELLPSAIKMILESDLFIIIGLPGLESWIDLEASEYSSLNVL